MAEHNRFTHALKRALTAPLALMMSTAADAGEPADIPEIPELDFAELGRIVDKRLQRAENAVVRDYLAQHGVEGEAADEAAKRFREERRAAMPDDGELERLRVRVAEAEATARKAAVDAEAQVQLERLGVPERNRADVLTLARDAMQPAYDGGSAEDGAKAVREAIGAVVARLPGLTAPRAEGAGSRGNFPRQEDAPASFRRRLEQARADGDTAAAVSVISSAAENGIILR